MALAFTIIGTGERDAIIELMSLSGEIVLKKQIQANIGKDEISLQGLPTGLYERQVIEKIVRP